MWVQSRGWEDPLEEEITTHSSILARRITWTEEPGSQRMRHTHTHTHLVKIPPTARYGRQSPSKDTDFYLSISSCDFWLCFLKLITGLLTLLKG